MAEFNRGEQWTEVDGVGKQTTFANTELILNRGSGLLGKSPDKMNGVSMMNILHHDTIKKKNLRFYCAIIQIEGELDDIRKVVGDVAYYFGYQNSTYTFLNEKYSIVNRVQGIYSISWTS